MIVLRGVRTRKKLDCSTFRTAQIEPLQSRIGPRRAPSEGLAQSRRPYEPRARQQGRPNQDMIDIIFECTCGRSERLQRTPTVAKYFKQGEKGLVGIVKVQKTDENARSPAFAPPYSFRRQKRLVDEKPAYTFKSPSLCFGITFKYEYELDGYRSEVSSRQEGCSPGTQIGRQLLVGFGQGGFSRYRIHPSFFKSRRAIAEC